MFYHQGKPGVWPIEAARGLLAGVMILTLSSTIDACKPVSALRKYYPTQRRAYISVWCLGLFSERSDICSEDSFGAPKRSTFQIF